MPLKPGTKLGPYEIIDRIGAGGMGEVYRGRDTRLDRIVAVKVCQKRFSDRFEHEARAVAAFNHPNICQLYDVGPDYLVMEYVEGKPISGPLAPSDFERLASQIAAALDAAHTKGFVHRDLKPDNILVTKSGQVKLLDFGLAKSDGRLAAAAPEVTLTKTLAQPGMITGTVQYMSPEQLQGLEVDSRSDIFAFGAVLYELLTGRRAFDANDAASIVAAILTAEPPPAPRPYNRVISRCLAKDPEARWQSARDIGAAIEFISDIPAAPASVHPNRRSRLIYWLTGSAAAVLGLTAVLALHRSPPPELLRFKIADQPALYSPRPIVSPDGMQVAIVSGETGSTRLLVQRFSSFVARRIEGADNLSDHAIWSPDSKEIAAVVQRKLFRFDVASGTQRLICDLKPSAFSYFGAGSWNSSGIIIFSLDGRICRVPADGGEVIAVTQVDRSRGELSHLEPQFLPDNRHFLFFVVNQSAADTAIYEGSIDSPQVQRIMPNAVGPVYFIGQDLLFVQGSTLMAQKFDWNGARLSGAPVSLQERIYANTSSFDPGAAFSASDNAIAYYPEGHPDTQLVWLDRRGNRISTLGPVGYYTNPSLSPNDERVAVGIFDGATNQRDIWIFDASGGSTRLTNDPKDDFNPLWSPEGKRIAFVSDRSGVRDLFIKNATPSSPEQLLLSTQAQKAAESWSPDGKFLLYTNQSLMQAIAVDGDRKSFLAVDCPGHCDQGAISPDGKWIAYRSQNAGAVEVNIEAFPRGATHWQVSTNGGGEPSWRRDGKELYFARDKQLFAVAIDVVAGGIVHGAPKLLFTVPLTLEIRRNRYVPSADGQRFLVVAQTEQRGLGAHIVMNWKSALNRQ